MQKPPLGKISSELKSYIDYLENRLAIIENNADVEMYIAINTQLSKLAKEINGMEIKLNTKRDEPMFERFLELVVKSKTISENMGYYRAKLKPEEIKKRSDASAENHIFDK